jgi:hypothetical protein
MLDQLKWFWPKSSHRGLNPKAEGAERRPKSETRKRFPNSIFCVWVWNRRKRSVLKKLEP